ncbi:interferon-induced very large GTPase 1-like [Hoplias malabaricus]|uniref:interferon-induced very large GTPase 1-like n=1 Tax=Hoplias malabaricus TaxID=27720 RepID=UPI0034620254
MGEQGVNEQTEHTDLRVLVLRVHVEDAMLLILTTCRPPLRTFRIQWHREWGEGIWLTVIKAGNGGSFWQRDSGLGPQFIGASSSTPQPYRPVSTRLPSFRAIRPVVAPAKPLREATAEETAEVSALAPVLAASELKEGDSRSREIKELLHRLGLEGKYEHKLTKESFLEITPSVLHPEEPRKEEDLVNAFMQRLLSIDYRARYISVKAEPPATKSQKSTSGDAFGTLFQKSIKSVKNKTLHIHPMDIQMAVFLCADPFLQQTMVTKLSQCQYAIPLLVPFSTEIRFPLWTMRQVSKSWKTIDTSGNVESMSLPMYQAQTPMVAFFRMGSISSSKSQLANSFINEKHNTFFHRHCPGSNKSRLLMDGVVEIAWYLPSGKNTDYFSDCVAFCNLHGDSHKHEPQRKILTEMASVNVVLLPNLDLENSDRAVVQDLCNLSTPLIVVLTDEEDQNEDAVFKFGERKYRVALKGRNQSDVSAALRRVIKECLSDHPAIFKIKDLKKNKELKLDERSEACQSGKKAAEEILTFLKTEDPSTVKNKYLPCQGELWHVWCQRNKDLRRLHSNNLETEKAQKQLEMKGLRKQQQKHGLSELMRLFVGSLKSLSNSEKMYFIKWIAVLLDDFTSNKLSRMHQQYDEKWKDVLTLKKTHDKEFSNNLTTVNTEKIQKEQSNLEQISCKLSAATLGLEHMLREMGQIYEASVSEKAGEQNLSVSYLPRLAADLLISGHPMELMDGDAAHVPLIWVSAVLKEVINKLGDKRVFVLSVLGIQSSGKSTMLNAMFGLQFAVSAGRCTRGAFMQLVKVSEEMKHTPNLDYILVVDTEGLRALELAGKATIHHDNELATFVVGLGNMTLINIFGENPSEMQDILQIVVQAFMRMKQVRLNPSCVFVHQNITDIAAGEKMMEGRRRLQDKLDEMTKLAAKDEVCDAEYFSDVIGFDVEDDVRYFAQLWEGSPPMAPPNPCYSENIQELKRAIVHSASQTNGMTLSQFKERVDDLWNALLNENFVFSFKNAHEISVYRKLEEEHEKWSWSLRSAMLGIENKMLNRVSSGNVETLQKQELMREMAVTMEGVQGAFKVFFEEENEKETLIQWKNKFQKQIELLHDELVNETMRKLDYNIQQKILRKKLDEQMVNYEKSLFEKSKELALKFRETDNGNSLNAKAEFDSVWKKWVSELAQNTPNVKDVNISDDVTSILTDFSERVLVCRHKQSKTYRRICTADYNAYVSMKRSMHNPIKILKPLKPEDQRSIQELISKVTDRTTQKRNRFPVSEQGYSSAYIQDIVREVRKLVQDFRPRDNTFEFKKEFFVDLSLYVCEKAEEHFTKLHRKYKEANDPLLYFEKKKAEYFKVFEKYCQGGELAAVLGAQICAKLKETILKSVYNDIATVICNQMRGKPPFNGNRADLEKHILKALAEQKGDKDKKFEKFLIYMKQPKIHFEQFIKDKFREFISAENPQVSSAIKTFIDNKQRSVRLAAEMAREEVRRNKKDLKTWMYLFSSSLVDELGDTRVHLSDAISEDVTDCDVLVDCMNKELLDVVEELNQMLCTLSDLNMETFRESPDEILIKHFCKCCWVQCPFCGAVCTNSQEGHPGKHNADFHRSCGMNGGYYRGTSDLFIEFCTTAVAGDKYFYPYTGSNLSVPYKNYASAGGVYEEWLISTDFSELAYWKWFICEFKENLQNHHKKRFSGRGEIPDQWSEFKQVNAVESLGIN